MKNFISNPGGLVNEKTTMDILQYLDYLSANFELRTLHIEPAVGLRNKGSFYGLLKDLDIDSRYHYYVLYVNGYTSSVDYDGMKKIIKLPNFERIDELTYLLTY